MATITSGTGLTSPATGAMLPAGNTATVYYGNMGDQNLDPIQQSMNTLSDLSQIGKVTVPTVQSSSIPAPTPVSPTPIPANYKPVATTGIDINKIAAPITAPKVTTPGSINVPTIGAQTPAFPNVPFRSLEEIRTGLAAGLDLATQKNLADARDYFAKAGTADSTMRWGKEAEINIQKISSLAQIDLGLHKEALNEASLKMQNAQANADRKFQADYANARNSMEAQALKQRYEFETSFRNAVFEMQALGLNTDVALRGAMFNAQLALQTKTFNTEMFQRSGMFNAQQYLQAGMFNTQTAQQASIYNANNLLRTGMFNASAGLQATSLDYSTSLQAAGLNADVAFADMNMMIQVNSIYQQSLANYMSTLMSLL